MPTYTVIGAMLAGATLGGYLVGWLVYIVYVKPLRRAVQGLSVTLEASEGTLKECCKMQARRIRENIALRKKLREAMHPTEN